MVIKKSNIWIIFRLAVSSLYNLNCFLPSLLAQELVKTVQYRTMSVNIVSYRTVSHGFTLFLLTDKHLRF